jgi:hypothetical protein
MSRAGDHLARVALCGHPGECGCQVAQCCESCPLERCKYDVGQNALQIVAADRRTLIVGALQRGASVATIVQSLGVSRRTVFRAIQGMERGVTNRTRATSR